MSEIGIEDSPHRGAHRDSGLDEFVATLKYLTRDSKDFLIESSESGAHRVPDGGYIVRASFDFEVFLPNSDRVDACLRWLRGEKPNPAEEDPVADGTQLSVWDDGIIDAEVVEDEAGGGEEDEGSVNF